MAGTIDSKVAKQSDEQVDKDAKLEQKKAEQRRAEERREGASEQAPGAMPPETHSPV